MAKYVGKKKIKKISQISIIHDVLIDELRDDAHFLEEAPEFWTEDQKQIYDLLHILEDQLKEKIINTINL